MARKDYKHRASRNKGRKPVAIWVWLLIGFLAGAGTVGFLCLKFAPEPAGDRWIGDRPPPGKKPGATTASSGETKRRSEVPPPSFDFYNLLPDQEVVVPEEELNRPVVPAKASREKPHEKPPAQPQRKYMLQVSSVRSAREAEALKAKLAFLGLQAQVSQARIKGVTWYRVRLGPFASTAAMQKARKRLAASGYSALPIALK